MKIYDELVDNLGEYQIIYEDDIKNLFCSYYHINKFIKKDGEIFHIKKDKFVNILNEILGELISEYFCLNTVKSKLYKIDDDSSKYCLLTKLFTECGKNYNYIDKLFPDFVKYNSIHTLNKLNRVYDENQENIYVMKNSCVSKINYSLKKMIVRDFITNTTDRHCENFMFLYDKSFVEMMPLYDYEYSFNNFFDFYSVFKINVFDKNDVDFIKNDDVFQELFEMAMLLNMSKIFKTLKDNYPIKLDFSEKWNIESIVRERKSDVKRYLLK